MPNFIYTQGGSVLTLEQRQFYEINGYILIRNLVDHKLLDECRHRFIDICNNKVDVGAMTVMKEQSLKTTSARGEHLINKIQDFLFDDILFKYATYKPMVDIIEDIIGPNISAVQSMLINKPPDAKPETSLHPLHQDLQYFTFRPAHKIVASWTAMERIDEKNGCLYVVPGTHSLQLQPHKDVSKIFAYHGIEGYEHAPKVYATMEKGDTIFFHPLLLHGSGPNLTKGFRKAISTHFADSNCYFIDVKGTSQHSLALEIERMALRRGLVVSLSDIWKNKSRLVKGEPGEFQNLLSSNL